MQAIKHTDILVVGGGAAGIAAAVAAARQGASVLLVERNEYLGGKATAAEVGTVCGLYAFSKAPVTHYIVKGFAKEFAEALRESSGTAPLSNNEGLHYLPYSIDAFKQLSLQYLADQHVTVLLGSSITKVTVSDQAIQSIFIQTTEGLIEYAVGSVVDCSGDAAISRTAALPTLKNEQYQAAAQVFSLMDVAEDNEARLGLILMKALRSAVDEGMLPDFFDRVYIVQGSLKDNKVSLKLGLPVSVTYEEGNLEAIQLAAHAFINQLTAFLVSQVPAFKQASIHHIAPEAGIRVGERASGKYILTAADVLSCHKFGDAIANGSWPIEEWALHKRVKMQYFPLDDFYQVPAGCLQSGEISNLFMAGRNISATSEAIASARVMGTCLQTGYAAGCLAAGKALFIGEEDVINRIQNQQL